jgi:chromosome segregation and condensation protein ScpB
VKGLVEREAVGNTYQFRITPALLGQLGISSKSELPKFGEFMNALDTFATNKTEETV